jgi:hypothetical protein
VHAHSRTAMHNDPNFCDRKFVIGVFESMVTATQETTADTASGRFLNYTIAEPKLLPTFSVYFAAL